MKLEDDIYKNKYNAKNAPFGIIGMQSQIIHPFTLVQSNEKYTDKTCVITVIVVEHL